MKRQKDVKIVRGYARNASDEARLRARGIEKIYREDRPVEQWGRWRMRSGEGLGVVDGFRAFGTTRKAMMDKVRVVHGWHAVVVDADTGERSDQKGAEMLDRGQSKYAAELRAPDKRRARDMQEKSVKARTKGRTPQREASAKWHGSPTLSNDEVKAALVGWSIRALYKFGKRKLPRGRRSVNK